VGEGGSEQDHVGVVMERKEREVVVFMTTLKRKLRCENQKRAGNLNSCHSRHRKLVEN